MLLLRGSRTPPNSDSQEDKDQDVYDSQEDEDNVNNSVQPTAGDSEHLLVLRRTCLTLNKQDDKWLCTNIFRSNCTVKGRVCSFVIDSRSSRNVISKYEVDKLAITQHIRHLISLGGFTKMPTYGSFNKCSFHSTFAHIRRIVCIAMWLQWTFVTYCWEDHGNLIEI